VEIAKANFEYSLEVAENGAFDLLLSQKDTCSYCKI
jgi:hypothetical protein